MTLTLKEVAKSKHEGTLTDVELEDSGYNASQLETLIRGFKVLDRYLEGEKDFQGIDLSGADLSGANLSGVNLSGANLRGTYLRSANLRSTNLSGANLSGADLYYSDLSLANLSNADLTEASLILANLMFSNLSGANLTRANLTVANLGKSNLQKAILLDAILNRTNLSVADLTTADLSKTDLSMAISPNFSPRPNYPDSSKLVHLSFFYRSRRVSSDNKRLYNFILLGHSGSGKTTLMGQCMYKWGILNRNIVEKARNEAIDKGKFGLRYAWLVDKLASERESGITMETTSITLEEYQDKLVNLFHVPDHKDLTNKLIDNILQVESAIVVVSAMTGEYEAGMSKVGRTHELINLAHRLGIRDLIIAVTKMDNTEPPYAENRFREIEKETKALAKSVGFDPNEVIILPISGLQNDNLIAASLDMKWFKGWEIYKNGNKHSGINLRQAFFAHLDNRN